MSSKLLRQFRPWSRQTSVTVNQTTPTSAAEAQFLMFKMREEALIKVGKDGAGKRADSSPSAAAVSGPRDQDDDLDFPNVTREELLGRCEKEDSTKPLTRNFRRIASEDDDDDATYTIRIFQWNVLSQTLGSKNDKFICCNPYALDWSTRRWRLIQEIIRYDPDIICLQEVDHPKLVQKVLGSINYSGRFMPKPDSPCIYMDSNNGPDGCAIFFKKTKFERIRKASRVLKVWGAPSNQVVLSMILKHKESGLEICVATTHLKAKFGALQSSFRNEQGKDILGWLETIRGDRPLIIGGDFNGEPSEPFYTTLTENKRTPLVSAYNLKSECDEDNLEYTTWKIRETGEQKHILDYIFHSPQLQTVSTLDMPTEQQIGEARLPSLQFASDHLSLVADIKL